MPTPIGLAKIQASYYSQKPCVTVVDIENLERVLNSFNGGEIALDLSGCATLKLTDICRLKELCENVTLIELVVPKRFLQEYPNPDEFIFDLFEHTPLVFR